MINHENRYPVFIVGSPRSGTSVLVTALVAAGYHGFHEGQFLYIIKGIDECVERYLFDWLAKAGPVNGSNGSRALKYYIDKSDLKQRLFHVIRDVESEWNPEAPWLDKTPEGPWLDKEMISGLPVIANLWPEGVFIFAKRRAMENVKSRLTKFPKFSFEYHCASWATTMAAWRGVRGRLPRYRRIEIDQWDIANSPDSIACKLQAFLCLDERQCHSVQQALRMCWPQQTEGGSAFRLQSLYAANWSDRQIETFIGSCGAELEAFGYSMDDSYFRSGGISALDEGSVVAARA